MFVAEEVFDGEECFVVGVVETDWLTCVELVAVDDVEDAAVALVPQVGDFLVFEEVFDFVEDVDFVTFCLPVVLGVEKTVDGVLRPVLCEV